MKETPWSRIRGRNSVDKEFLDIVGNGKPTGSVLEETVAVSDTMLINVQNRHISESFSELCRMREIHRHPEVPEERVPVGESFDCHARITSKELASTHWLQILGQVLVCPSPG